MEQDRAYNPADYGVGQVAAARQVRQETTAPMRPLNSRLGLVVDRQLQAHARMSNTLEAIALALGCAEPVALSSGRTDTPRPPEPVPTASIHAMRLENMLEQYSEANLNLAN